MNHIPKYQERVSAWIEKCFDISPQNMKQERSHRFLEESLELAQSLDISKTEVVQLVNYVYSRPIGDPQQEIGGVMLTLAALCSANDFDMDTLGDKELDRVWENIDKIRRKRQLKMNNSPLP